MDIYLASMRVMHIFSGIVWIGLLYYFNFVQGFAFPKMEGPARSNATVILVPRALAFFRYAALFTLLFGVTWIISAYASHFQGGAYNMHSARFKSILIGGGIGAAMFLNVWLIIWPNQRRIIKATKEGKQVDPKWGRQATLASRTNVMLSVPMLFFMIAAQNLTGLWS